MWERSGTPGAHTGGRSAAPAARRAAALGPIFSERRGLSKPGAPRGRQLLRQALVLPFQPIALPLQPIALPLQLIALVPRPHQLLAQPRDLFVVVPDLLVTIVVCGMPTLIGHARFMADSRK